MIISAMAQNHLPPKTVQSFVRNVAKASPLFGNEDLRLSHLRQKTLYTYDLPGPTDRKALLFT